jgi:uncharacterized protein
MPGLKMIALAVLAVLATGTSAFVGKAQTPSTECAQLSEMVDDDAPLGAGQNAASQRLEPSQAEAACRSDLKGDPTNPTVMFLLGRALSLGNKPREAIRFYFEAADRGHTGAMNDLGGVFEYGLGAPKNVATALVWYERAAELGHAGAMVHLGRLSESGIGVSQDFANAKRWYERAAARGQAAAMNLLADLLRYGRGEAANLPAAASWYLKAAQLGLASAMNSLGELSEAGTGVPQNDRTARTWYQKAADLGHADAMGNIGQLFESGRGGPQNLETAKEWYVKGAAGNGRVAMHNLGAMLENGRGMAKNLAEAAIWYERAAALAYPPALNDLGRSYLVGIGVPKNYVRAKTLFEQAAQLGDAKAMNDLGLLYLNGTGVQRDVELSRIWFERAAALDNTDARTNLKRMNDAGLVDGAQIAAWRASCTETCSTLHKSYVNSVCERYSTTADGDRPERTKCIGMSLALAQRCRASCRELAPTSLANNKCAACFQTLRACSVSSEPGDSQGVDKLYTVDSKACLAASAECTASCLGQAAFSTSAPATAGEKPN